MRPPRQGGQVPKPLMTPLPSAQQPKVAMPSPSISDDADQVVPELVPESEPSTPEAAQEVPFEAVARAKLLSDWPELAWAQDGDPWLWQDVLSWQLWRVLAGPGHTKDKEPRHLSECLGYKGGWGL